LKGSRPKSSASSGLCRRSLACAAGGGAGALRLWKMAGRMLMPLPARRPPALRPEQASRGGGRRIGGRHGEGGRQGTRERGGENRGGRGGGGGATETTTSGGILMSVSLARMSPEAAIPRTAPPPGRGKRAMERLRCTKAPRCCTQRKTARARSSASPHSSGCTTGDCGTGVASSSSLRRLAAPRIPVPWWRRRRRTARSMRTPAVTGAHGDSKACRIDRRVPGGWAPASAACSTRFAQRGARRGAGTDRRRGAGAG
jgi:hypothetical protein